MSLIEVKNNLLKFCYEENLVLSGFVRVTDAKNSYIAQVLHLEATRVGKVAIAKILFMYNNDEISSYDGSIPSLRAEISPIDSSVLLDTLEKNAPLNIGSLAQQNQKLYVDMEVLQDNPIICAEKFFATKVFLNNLAIQLQLNKKKVIVFDTVGIFHSNKISLGRDFKLPLNDSAINFIYEHGFSDATAESKALIQSIFEELSEYAKTVPFIPFNTFKSVVDTEFMQTKLIQLILLKNKIKQIGDLGIYGEVEQDFSNLNAKIQNDNTIVVDLSGANEGFQRECIKYVYTLLENSNQEFYSFLPLGNGNSDTNLLNEINNIENVHTTVICGYDYKYLNNLKQTSKNMFMFTPLKQQKDFGGYNIFLQKLAEDEFIAYGKMTKFVPLIVKLHPIKSDDIVVSQQPIVQQAPVQEPQEVQEVEKVDNALVEKFVNTITPESVNIQTEQTIVEEPSVAEADTSVLEEIVVNEETEDDESTDEDFVEDLVDSIDEEVPDEMEPLTNEQEELVVEDIVEAPEAPAQEEDDAEDILGELANEIVEEEPVAALDEVPAEVPVEQETPVSSEDELAQALEEIPDEEDDDELSDDDLDMIEELSTPDEEIESIALQPQVAPAPEEVPVEPMPVEPTMEPQPAAPMTPPQSSKPEVRQNTTNPRVPEYSADIPEEDKVGVVASFQQGDKVVCEEFGEGIVEKVINYGEKELCSINFASVGRRLLNPELTELRKL